MCGHCDLNRRNTERSGCLLEARSPYSSIDSSAVRQGGGSNVKITDFAANPIRFSGFEPDRDIKIIFTGLRPGEKLYEELSFHDERIKPTSHEAIRVFDGGQ